MLLEIIELIELESKIKVTRIYQGYIQKIPNGFLVGLRAHCHTMKLYLEKRFITALCHTQISLKLDRPDHQDLAIMLILFRR